MFYYMEMIHKPKDLKYKDWNGNVVFFDEIFVTSYTEGWSCRKV